MKRFLSCVLLLLLGVSAHAERIMVAAASDLRFALDEIVADFHQAHSGDEVEVVYGSSGNFYAQIRQGAPYDLYFSADIAYPRAVHAAGAAASEVESYAIGHIVLWGLGPDAGRMQLADLLDQRVKRIAIANPKHAPYGKRAEEALRAAGILGQVEAKLVYGENIAQTAQFVQTGNAEVGIIALSLALSPELRRDGSYSLIPDTLHQPLEQGFVILERARDNALAARFAAYVRSAPARAVLSRYGFALPGDAGTEPAPGSATDR